MFYNISNLDYLLYSLDNIEFCFKIFYSFANKENIICNKLKLTLELILTT